MGWLKKVVKEEPEEFFEHKLLFHGKSAEQIQQEIQTRQQLMDNSLREIDYQISQCAFSLEQFQFFGLGYNVGVDMRRNLLERMLADLRKERRNTQLRAWENVIALRKGLRDTLAEYYDILRRYRLIQRD